MIFLLFFLSNCFKSLFSHNTTTYSMRRGLSSTYIALQSDWLMICASLEKKLSWSKLEVQHVVEQLTSQSEENR